MKLNRKLVCAAVLAAITLPAWALQLGQIQVKSALNQPLVAAIPLHPANLSELEGLSVALAPAQDFARAGLPLTATSQSLRFHVVTDNNGQKLILVTSSEPVTDPYLDFLVQVNTRDGKQVREFVVLLNPVIAAATPEVQAAPVAEAQVAGPVGQVAGPVGQVAGPVGQVAGPVGQVASPVAHPAAAAPPPPPPPPPPSPPPPPPPPPPSSASSAPAPASAPAPKAWPMPAPQPVPQAAPPPPTAAQPLPPAAASTGAPASAAKIAVKRGDTLYHLATDAARDSGTNVNQMMLAMLATNPDAFAKDNVNTLKAGAILRIPTRDEVDRTSLARASAEVRRQNEAWQAARPKPATMVAGTAEQAAANATAAPNGEAPSSAHLSLVPPSSGGGEGASRSGVKGGSSNDTVAGLKQQLQNDRSTLASLDQANADLDSRVRSLKDISAKSDKLLSLKDATVAELQRKLADVQAKAASTSAVASAAPASAASATASAAHASASASAAAPAHASAPTKAPATSPSARAGGWMQNPIAWIIAGVVAVILILLGLVMRRRAPEGGDASGHGPLPDPADVVRGSTESGDDEAAALHEDLADHPNDPAKHLALCRHYYGRRDIAGFLMSAELMHEAGVDPDGVEWREVRVMGRQLAPHNPLFATAPVSVDDPYGLEAMRRRPASAPVDAQGDDATVVAPVAKPEVSAPKLQRERPIEIGPLEGDSVDTKLDLARAYIDMGDPAGAKSILEEVLREGSQMQQDEARRLLAEVSG